MVHDEVKYKLHDEEPIILRNTQVCLPRHEDTFLKGDCCIGLLTAERVPRVTRKLLPVKWAVKVPRVGKMKNSIRGETRRAIPLRQVIN